MDEELFPLLDGTPAIGPGRYTSQSIRNAWRKRVQEGLPWGQTGGNADTTEAIERTLALAVRYAMQPHELATVISDNARLTQTDDVVLSMTVAYGAVLGLLVQGHKLDKNLSNTMMELVKTDAEVVEGCSRYGAERTKGAGKAYNSSNHAPAALRKHVLLIGCAAWVRKKQDQ